MSTHRYASEKLKFGCLDVGMWPRFAKEVKISTQTWSNQLPATVLYSRGQEVARIPAASQFDELGVQRNYYTKVCGGWLEKGCAAAYMILMHASGHINLWETAEQIGLASKRLLHCCISTC